MGTAVWTWHGPSAALWRAFVLELQPEERTRGKAARGGVIETRRGMLCVSAVRAFFVDKEKTSQKQAERGRECKWMLLLVGSPQCRQSLVVAALTQNESKNGEASVGAGDSWLWQDRQGVETSETGLGGRGESAGKPSQLFLFGSQTESGCLPFAISIYSLSQPLSLGLPSPSGAQEL
ncbi:hypothetical protein L7F22_004155 [Adiantum nelumboides]|nr:hypothetical protein [Adiantum nelumboides]